MSGVELKPCPFCGAKLHVNGTPITRDIKTVVHTSGDCILSGHNWWFVPRFIDPWNRRTPDPAQIRADALRDALAALSDAGYGSSVAAWVILALIDTPPSPTAVDVSPAPDDGGTP